MGCHHGRGHGCGSWHDVYDCDPPWGRGPGFGYGRARRYSLAADAGDEAAEELEDYKASLEAQIRRLERRIGSLRQRTGTD